MDKGERETHDFMNVESFSQLPFIRPAPVKEKGIRLFGIEFGGNINDSNTNGVPTDESASAETNEDSTKESETADNNRRFECHYCCRNFPTSQALGGHQNAHKRERQHAKRAHPQSTMVHNSLSDAHIYGLVNYRPATMTYPSWNSYKYANNDTSRFYSNHGSCTHHQQPINGNPLGLWKIPAVHGSASLHRDRSLHPLPLFAGEEMKPPQMGGSTSQGRYGYESKKSVQDHVSLDLHL